MCEEFTPDTVFYWFGRSSFGLCVNGVLFGDVSLFYGCSARLSGCPDGSARCIGMRDRPTRGFSRAAERELFERHGITKETILCTG